MTTQVTQGGVTTFTQLYGHAQPELDAALEVCPLVFVYGSLKEGYSNHRRLGISEFVTDTTTEDSYFMTGMGFPLVIPSHKIPEEYSSLLHPVQGEVYKVNHWEDLLSMDFLEGHPDFYTRRLIETSCGLTVWTYLFEKFYTDMTERQASRTTLENNTWLWF